MLLDGLLADSLVSCLNAITYINHQPIVLSTLVSCLSKLQTTDEVIHDVLSLCGADIVLLW